MSSNIFPEATTPEEYSDIEDIVEEPQLKEPEVIESSQVGNADNYYYTAEEQEAYYRHLAEQQQLQWAWNTRCPEPGEICGVPSVPGVPGTPVWTGPISTPGALGVPVFAGSPNVCAPPARRQRRRRGGVRNRSTQGSQMAAPMNSGAYLNNIVASISSAFFNSRDCRIHPRTVASRIRETLLLNQVMGPDELYNSTVLIREICYELLQSRDVSRYASGYGGSNGRS
jgi:hypothetical protein